MGSKERAKPRNPDVVVQVFTEHGMRKRRTVINLKALANTPAPEGDHLQSLVEEVRIARETSLPLPEGHSKRR